MSLESIDGHAWAQTCQELFHLTALRKVSQRDVVSSGNGYPKVPSLLKTSVDSVIISNNYQIINNYASKWFLNYWKLITYLKRKLLLILPRTHQIILPGFLGRRHRSFRLGETIFTFHLGPWATRTTGKPQSSAANIDTFQIEALTQPRQNLEIQGNQQLDFSNLIMTRKNWHKDRHFEVPTLQVPTRLLRLPACWPVLGTACAVPVVVTDQNGSERMVWHFEEFLQTTQAEAQDSQGGCVAIWLGPGGGHSRSGKSNISN